MGSGYQYSVVFQNDTSLAATACLYATGAGLTGPGTVYSVAWLTKLAAPTTTVVFQWQTGYDFFWAETGALGEGAMITASQVWSVGTLNSVTLTHAAGYYTFASQTTGSDPASNYILEDRTIPANMAAAGLGIGGRPAFAVQAQPNTTLIFKPVPAYFIVFGLYTGGQILDPPTVQNPGALVFPPNVYSLSATLQSDNTWKIESLASKNALRVAEAARTRALESQ